MTLQYTLKRLTLLAAVSLVILLITSNLNGSGGLLTLLSINQVTNPPASAASYRFEPSTVSNLAGGWVTSWDDLGTTRGNANNPKAYTSSWNGSNWSAPTEHRSPANGPYLCADVPLGDLYTYWDSGRNKFLMVATEFGTVVHCIWIRYSTDSTGSSWQPFQLVMKGNNTGPIAWDFPSVTVSQTNGRIVVGASKLVAEKNVGYYTSFSDDGVNWSCPVSVNGPAGGAVSRIVASSSGFHAFVPLDDTSQNMRTLQHWFSTNGTSWSAQSPIATPYGIPLLSSDTFITTCIPLMLCS